ncbi:MAG: iron-containing alcohol dehydrogenase [Aggregatilineales bacterium]
MRFEFATATRIIFGNGVLAQIGDLVRASGTRALVITGSKAERAARLIDLLSTAGIHTEVYSVADEPTIEDAQAGVNAVRGTHCDVIVSFGGGSVLDAGKAIAALATNEGDPLDYLEVIGKGQPLINPPLPFIAIPTTAGTGAEVTRNAVLKSTAHQVKVSLRSPLMLPKIALVDPELTHTVPPHITATTGMDALTQVLEPFVSVNANPITDAFCREGLRLAGRSLRRTFTHGDDAHAREDMMLVSLLGGLALANAKLGAVHGFAGPLGGMFPAPHGAVCAALLPHVMQANVTALREREPGNPALQRYDEIAVLLTGNPAATIDDALMWITGTRDLLNIPTLETYGISSAHLPDIVAQSAKSSSMKGNPITLTDAEMTDILEQAL